MYLYHSSPTIANNTITCNSADDGGGLYLWNESTPAIANTIVVSNSSGIYRSDYVAAPTLRYNCVYGNIEYDYFNLADPTGIDGNISADPLFVQSPDAEPDGVWGTGDDEFGDLQLLPGSPCIDAGDNAAVPADVLDLDGDGDTSEPLPVDLAGAPRFVVAPLAPDVGRHGPPGPIVDMGAYEFQPDWLAGLEDAVVVLELPHGIERSFLAKLAAASSALEDGNRRNNMAACNAIRAFIDALEALSNKHVAEAEAAALVEAAHETLELLGCSDKHGGDSDLRLFRRERPARGR